MSGLVGVKLDQETTIKQAQLSIKVQVAKGLVNEFDLRDRLAQ